ncbi:hypothetical protein M426DRAFT_44773, partial [Hypoxylon sp. CI-4A]
YKVLGVNRYATPAEIKIAYRKLALKYHPDKTETPQVADTEKFIIIKEAYETLSDPEQRRIYNR